VSSAAEGDLQRLAASVDAKISEILPAARPVPRQALVLAAISLAHDLEAERALRHALERRSRDMLRRVLVRVEDALDSDEVDSAEG
jgi:cell division protein ZapA